MTVGELIKRLSMVDQSMEVVIAAIPELDEGGSPMGGETLIAEDIRIAEIAHIRPAGMDGDQLMKEVVPMIALMPAYSYLETSDDEDEDPEEIT